MKEAISTKDQVNGDFVHGTHLWHLLYTSHHWYFVCGNPSSTLSEFPSADRKMPCACLWTPKPHLGGTQLQHVSRTKLMEISFMVPICGTYYTHHIIGTSFVAIPHQPYLNSHQPTEKCLALVYGHQNPILEAHSFSTFQGPS